LDVLFFVCPLNVAALYISQLFAAQQRIAKKLKTKFNLHNKFDFTMCKIPQIMHEMRLILLFTQPLHSKKSTQKQTETKTVARLRFSKIFPNRIAVFIRNVGPPSSTFHVPALEAN